MKLIPGGEEKQRRIECRRLDFGNFEMGGEVEEVGTEMGIREIFGVFIGEKMETVVMVALKEWWCEAQEERPEITSRLARAFIICTRVVLSCD